MIRLFLAAGAAAVGLGSFGSVASPPPARQTSDLPRPPGSHVATLPRAPGDKPQETAVAINPRDPRNAVVSYHQSTVTGSDHHPQVSVDAHAAWTADGGRTWTVAANTTHPSYRRSLDVTVAFDLHGHAFLAYIGMDHMRFRSPATTRHGEFVNRSYDGGRTWDTTPVTLIEHPEKSDNPIFEHMPSIIADNDPGSPRAGTWYMLWDRMLANGRSEDVVFARSTDDGKTWSEPRVIGTYPVRVGHSLEVGPDGTLYVLYSPFDYRKGGTVSYETFLAASRDGGRTFETPRPVMRTQGRSWPVDNFPREGGGPGFALDPRGSGRMFVVWGDYRNGDRDIFAITSDDGGSTWTAPVRVNDDPQRNGRDQIMQALAVDPTDGAAYVVFYDRRADPDNLRATVTLARSSDGGRTFVNYAWSDKAVDPKQSSLGDYIGLAARDGRVYGAWPENAPWPKGMASKKPQKPAPADMEVKDETWPFGPTALRIGIADFRAAAPR